MSRAAARRWAEQADSSHLRCRVGRSHHDWPDPSRDDITYNQKTGCWQIENMICGSCGAEGTRTIDKTTGRVAVHMRVRLPENYAYRSGSGRPMDAGERGIARLEWIRRCLAGDL